ncbi:MAG: alkaline phosphatase family protein [Deltaproteobacteria bacterium]|nr:alkaline phosphatase family protein [Deltaproteobacteria bacterium]
MQKRTKRNEFTRREILKAMGSAAVAASLGGLDKKVWAKTRPPKVIVLGIDGMDPTLVRHFIKQGKMPNTKKLTEMGGFSPLTTSIPPQSPVAWANFITGMNPGGHGIFDFIHREPETLIPYLSTSRTTPPTKKISLGDWRIPLSSGEVKLLRGGKAFWSILEENGIPATVFKIPSNFPPEESEARTLSGMGTPDLLGTYGTFSYYTVDPPKDFSQMGGGKVFPVEVRDNKVVAHLVGPHNTFRRESPRATIDFTVWIDPLNPAAKIDLQGREIVLKEKEWSDWIVVTFDMIPCLGKVSGILRIYLKELRPSFRLYVSPININPADPALPISTPSGYCKKLVDDLGYFYTQGMPEDTKALSNLVLTDEEYLEQARFVLDERRRFYDYELTRFREGFFFFYFSSLDLNSHMFWRTLDGNHPLYTSQLAKEFGWFIPHLYQQMDAVIGQAMKIMDENTTLMVISDHGFLSFRRGFNLNTWLLNNEYAALDDPLSQEETEFFNNVDWGKTRAYGLGINSLYLNRAHREKHGIISPGSNASALANELAERLTKVKDPLTGEPVISNVYKPENVYTGEFTHRAPDLIIGYNRTYRSSWETILGKYPRDEFVDNHDKWSGDHCMDNVFLPGVLISNRKITATHPALYDLAPSILNLFGIKKSRTMIGTSVFG